MTTDSPDFQQEPAIASKARGFWPSLRRLLIFQVKLYVDALRDFLLSLLSLGAFLFDVVHRKEGEESHFDQVLKLGRRTEEAINLFEQHDPHQQGKNSVDGVINEVEERIRRERQ